MRKKAVRLNAITNAQLMLKLSEGVYTQLELAEESGLCVRTVRPYLKALHKVGVIHICEWTEDALGHRSQVVYKLGKGKDVEKPKMDEKAIAKRYREKLKQRKLMKALDAIKTVCTATSARRINKTLAANQESIRSRA